MPTRRVCPLEKSTDAQLQLLLAARKARARSVQKSSGSTNVYDHFSINTEDARKRIQLPSAQSPKGKGISLALSNRMLFPTTSKQEKGSSACGAIDTPGVDPKVTTVKIMAGIRLGGSPVWSTHFRR